MLAPNPATDVLQRARNLISDPKKWVRFYQGQTSEGRLVFPGDATAVAFCALGAIAKVRGEMYYTATREVEARPEIQALFQAMQTDSSFGIANFNNERSHEEVIGAFDAAIEIVARGRDRAGL